jgi:hypothetical protein
MGRRGDRDQASNKTLNVGRKGVGFIREGR